MRFRYMLPVVDKAQLIIQDAIRDLAGNDIEKYKRLSTQFRILDYRDIYIDDTMENDEYGYILKCLRSIGLLEEKAELVNPVP